MTRATGVDPIARKAANHKISRTYRNERGIRTIARAAKAMIAPRVSKGPSTAPSPRPAPEPVGVEEVLVAIAPPSPHRNVSCVWKRASTVGVKMYSKTEMLTKHQTTPECTAFATPSAPPLAVTPL